MSTRRFPRVSRPWLVALSAGLLVLSGTACSGTTPVRNAMNANASPSLVSAWNIQFRPVGNGQAELTFRPLVSSARKYVGADTLGYISLKGLMEVASTRTGNEGYCHACFSGEYPTKI